MSLVALDELPPALFGDDPWLHLAKARALAGDGRLIAALDAYGRAQDAFGNSPHARLVRTARRVVRCWASRTHTPAASPLEHLRAATVADPASVVQQLGDDDSAAARLVAGAAALLAGRPAEAVAHARAITARTGLEMLELALARVLEQVAISFTGGSVDHGRLEAAATTLEHLGLTAIVRVVRTAMACMRGARHEPLAALAASRRTRGDVWGAAMIDLTLAIAASRSGREAGAQAERAVAAFNELGAPVLAAWATIAAGSVATNDPDVERLVDDLARSPAIVGTDWALVDSGDRVPGSGPWTVRLHGGLSIDTGNSVLSLEDDLRPHARQGLALLLLDLGRPVHEDRLTAALWPGVERAAAKRRLQVLVSCLRGALEDVGLDRGDLARHGLAYVLHFPDGSVTDVARANAALDAADAARRGGDVDAEATQLRAAVEVMREPLLPTLDGADWLDDERDRSQLRRAVATRRLAEIDLANGDLDGAIHWSMASIDADPYSEAAGLLLASARDRATAQEGARTSNAPR